MSSRRVSGDFAVKERTSVETDFLSRPASQIAIGAGPLVLLLILPTVTEVLILTMPEDARSKSRATRSRMGGRVLASFFDVPARRQSVMDVSGFAFQSGSFGRKRLMAERVVKVWLASG